VHGCAAVDQVKTFAADHGIAAARVERELFTFIAGAVVAGAVIAIRLRYYCRSPFFRLEVFVPASHPVSLC
jgi:hypothetical protein